MGKKLAKRLKVEEGRACVKGERFQCQEQSCEIHWVSTVEKGVCGKASMFACDTSKGIKIRLDWEKLLWNLSRLLSKIASETMQK